jgi:hypothetical protein
MSSNKEHDTVWKVTGVEFDEEIGHNDFVRLMLLRKSVLTSTMLIPTEEYRLFGSPTIGDTIDVHLTLLQRATDK